MKDLRVKNRDRRPTGGRPERKEWLEEATIRKFIKDVFAVFDADKSGQHAADDIDRAADQLRTTGKDLHEDARTQIIGALADAAVKGQKTPGGYAADSYLVSLVDEGGAYLRTRDIEELSEEFDVVCEAYNKMAVTRFCDAIEPKLPEEKGENRNVSALDAIFGRARRSDEKKNSPWRKLRFLRHWASNERRDDNREEGSRDQRDTKSAGNRRQELQKALDEAKAAYRKAKADHGADSSKAERALNAIERAEEALNAYDFRTDNRHRPRRQSTPVSGDTDAGDSKETRPAKRSILGKGGEKDKQLEDKKPRASILGKILGSDTGDKETKPTKKKAILQRGGRDTGDEDDSKQFNTVTLLFRIKRIGKELDEEQREDFVQQAKSSDPADRERVADALDMYA